MYMGKGAALLCKEERKHSPDTERDENGMETKLTLITRKFEVNNNEEPYEGNPHVRFRGGEQSRWAWLKLLRHCQTKGAETVSEGLNGCDMLSTRSI